MNFKSISTTVSYKALSSLFYIHIYKVTFIRKQLHTYIETSYCRSILLETFVILLSKAFCKAVQIVLVHFKLGKCSLRDFCPPHNRLTSCTKVSEENSNYI